MVANAPYERMPIYVKAGSIVPTGPDIQHVHDKPADPLTLNVYTGANGVYELYEDDGKTYEYENGAFTRIPLVYDAASDTLTIGDREGSYAGMLKERQIHVRWISGRRKDAADFTAKPDATVRYVGKALSVRRENPIN